MPLSVGTPLEGRGDASGMGDPNQRGMRRIVLRAEVGSRRGAPLTPSRLAQGIAFVVVTVLTVGFGTHRMAPVDPRAVGALKPDIEDPEAGLVGIAPDQ
jgi:hypothetical protein